MALSLLSRLSLNDGLGIGFEERREASAAVDVELLFVVDLADVAVCFDGLVTVEADTDFVELLFSVCGAVWANVVVVISKAPIINLIITFCWFILTRLCFS
jgi:hypothetical protein